MKSLRFFALLSLLMTTRALGEDWLLPVFALNVEASGGSVWSSEVYVTNPGPATTTVHIGGLIEGARSDTPQCLPIVQPFIDVAPLSTRLINQGDLALAIGCPDWAWGALTFSSEDPVVISSRMINTGAVRIPEATLLQGFGQEIEALPLDQLLEPGKTYLLPGVAWHPNSCGPNAFDTNVFLVNPGDVPVEIELSPEPDAPRDIVVDGNRVASPYRLTVPARAVRVVRLAGPDPETDDCRQPVVGAFSIVADGPWAVIGSAIDRATDDARTITPIPKNQE